MTGPRTSAVRLTVAPTNVRSIWPGPAPMGRLPAAGKRK